MADENFAENEHSFESENDEGRRKSKKRHITGYSLFLRHQMVRFILLLRMLKGI